MKKRLAVISVLALAACSSPPPPQNFAPLDYSYLRPFTFKVANISVVNSYVPGPDEAQLNADLTQPFEAIRPALNQVGAQLTVQAREWYLADVIRIAMADGPLTDGERQAALAIGLDLGMTHAQAIGVIATTEQSAGRG